MQSSRTYMCFFVFLTGRLDRSSPDVTPPLTEASDYQKSVSPMTYEATKEFDSKFAEEGIMINENEIRVDFNKISSLKKRGIAESTMKPQSIVNMKSPVPSRIPKSPMLVRRKSFDNSHSTYFSDEKSVRNLPTHRSVRQSSPIASFSQRNVEFENKLYGRSSVSPMNSRSRPQIKRDLLNSSSRSSSLTRNTPSRSFQCQSQPRQRSATRASSVNTSPNKNGNLQSPLAQQLLEAAGKARNDAQILERIKQILTDYAKNKKCDVDDLTAAWVANGHFDGEEVTQNKFSSKRSSSASISSDGPLSINIMTPRREDKGLSKIPAPIRSNTGLF